jgi:hypothetical protein
VLAHGSPPVGAARHVAPDEVKPGSRPRRSPARGSARDLAERLVAGGEARRSPHRAETARGSSALKLEQPAQRQRDRFPRATIQRMLQRAPRRILFAEGDLDARESLVRQWRQRVERCR